MIDWDALIGERDAVENDENSPPSGEVPHSFSSVSAKVGEEEPSINRSCKEFSPLSPPSPLKKQGDGLRISKSSC